MSDDSDNHKTNVEVTGDVAVTTILRISPIVYLITCIVAAFAVGALFWLGWDQHRQLKNQQHVVNAQAKILASQGGLIQRERADAIMRDCREGNKRHDNTIHALDAIMRQNIREGRTTAQQAARSRQLTILLIDALAPRQDCKALVKAAVSPPKKKR